MKGYRNEYSVKNHKIESVFYCAIYGKETFKSLHSIQGTHKLFFFQTTHYQDIFFSLILYVYVFYMEVHKIETLNYITDKHDDRVEYRTY